jgi:hypothetical protein
MEQVTLETLRYPVGKYKKPEIFNQQEVKAQIKILSKLPAIIKRETTGLSEAELQYIYRPEGWSVRQVVHHFADSHMNAFIRMKLSLTEDKPSIKPYIENEWAKLPDTTDSPIEWSLQILEGLHHRMVKLLNSLSEEDMERSYIHPEYKNTFTLYQVVAMYAWHCNHHTAHIKQAKKHKNQF